MGLIKCLICDFDGLILDTEEPSYTAWSQLYADYGLELDIHAWANGLGASEAAFNPVTHLQGMLNHTVDEAMLRKSARGTSRPGTQAPPALDVRTSSVAW